MCYSKGSHTHPYPVAPIISGWRLDFDETILDGDMYPSLSGNWEEVPDHMIGKEVKACREKYIVRPFL
jgi:hypothetical protein